MPTAMARIGARAHLAKVPLFHRAWFSVVFVVVAEESIKLGPSHRQLGTIENTNRLLRQYFPNADSYSLSGLTSMAPGPKPKKGKPLCRK